jgi:hypothetical protein
MAGKRIKFRRKGIRRFKKKKMGFGSSSLMNFFGTKPVLKKIRLQTAVYAQILAGTNTGSYTIYGPGTVAGAFGYQCLYGNPGNQGIQFDAVFAQMITNFNLFCVKGFVMTVNTILPENASYIDGTAMGLPPVTWAALPDLYVSIRTPNLAIISAVQVASMNRAIQVKLTDRSRTSRKMAFTLPPVLQDYNVGSSYSYVYGSKVWMNAHNFYNQYNGSNGAQPCIVIGSFFTPGLQKVISTIGDNYLPVAEVIVDAYCLFTNDFIATTL